MKLKVNWYNIVEGENLRAVLDSLPEEISSQFIYAQRKQYDEYYVRMNDTVIDLTLEHIHAIAQNEEVTLYYDSMEIGP